jgi:hypothetical protein
MSYDGLVKSPSAALRGNFGKGAGKNFVFGFLLQPAPSSSFCAPSPAWGGRAFYETIRIDETK